MPARFPGARRAIAQVVVVLVAAAGAAAVSASPGVEARAAGGLSVSGGSPAQRTLVRQIIGRMGPTLISAVKLEPPPKSWGDWPRTVTYLKLTASRGMPGQSDWQTWLLAGAFADLSRKEHLPVVFGFGSPDGGDRLGVTGLPTPPAATAAGASALEARVTQAVSATAGTSGVQIVSLAIFKPDGLAFALVLQVADPAAYMEHDLPGLLMKTRGGRPILDGTFLALEDSTGSVVWTAQQSARVGAGGDYVRPDLAGCNPIIDSGRIGYSPPDCPAP